jgi:uncharacterized FlaG/YvyC family protein
MGENLIQNVGAVESDARAGAIYQMTQNQLFKIAETLPVVQPEKTEKVSWPEKPAEKAAQSLLPVTNGDTYLRFMVDEKNNDITVYVVDRASRRVMRSIPPSEVNNLKAGDLLKLLA